MIPDTSAWVEYLRGTGSAIHRRLRDAIDQRELLWVPAVVRQEVLQGARSPRDFIRLRALLEQFRRLDLPDPHRAAAHAAWLYARCRWQGISLRSPIDCLVASHAIAAGQPLLAMDKNFAAIAAIDARLHLL